MIRAETPAVHLHTRRTFWSPAGRREWEGKGALVRTVCRRQQEILATGLLDLQKTNHNLNTQLEDLKSQLEAVRRTLRDTQTRKVKF